MNFDSGSETRTTTTSSMKGWICLCVFGLELGNTTVSPRPICLTVVSGGSQFQSIKAEA